MSDDDEAEAGKPLVEVDQDDLETAQDQLEALLAYAGSREPLGWSPVIVTDRAGPLKTTLRWGMVEVEVRSGVVGYADDVADVVAATFGEDLGNSPDTGTLSTFLDGLEISEEDAADAAADRKAEAEAKEVLETKVVELETALEEGADELLAAKEANARADAAETATAEAERRAEAAAAQLARYVPDSASRRELFVRAREAEAWLDAWKPAPKPTKAERDLLHRSMKSLLQLVVELAGPEVPAALATPAAPLRDGLTEKIDAAIAVAQRAHDAASATVTLLTPVTPLPATWTPRAKREVDLEAMVAALPDVTAPAKPRRRRSA